MNGTINVMRRELTGYFATPVAYVFLIIFLVMTGIFAFYLGTAEGYHKFYWYDHENEKAYFFDFDM